MADFFQKFKSLFVLGFFSKTRERNRNRNKISENFRGRSEIRVGCYLKPGYEYEKTYQELMESSVTLDKKSWWIPKLLPKTGDVVIVWQDQPTFLEKQDTFWMVTDLVVDEFSNFKFQYIGPTGFGWSVWMTPDEFERKFTVVQ